MAEAPRIDPPPTIHMTDRAFCLQTKAARRALQDAYNALASACDSSRLARELDMLYKRAFAKGVEYGSDGPAQGVVDAPVPAPGESLLHPVHQVWFRAGLLACREYMARFVEAESPSIAMSIRANWWPALGQDFGPPRQLAFAELTEGEYGTPTFRCKTAAEVSPTLEALPIALAFLEQGPHGATSEPAALPALRALVGQQWQPIETAPKDGRLILVVEPKNSQTRLVTFFAQWGKWLSVPGRIIVRPTHWMSLPNPPPVGVPPAPQQDDNRQL